jgi:hypothetical protein
MKMRLKVGYMIVRHEVSTDATHEASHLCSFALLEGHL